jgi:hypothetical protein
MQMTQQEATDFFSDLFGGEHHLPSPVKEHGMGWCVTFRNDFATYDFNTMTRFVIMCHDKCVRGEVQPAGPMLKLAIHKRTTREWKMNERHPTIEQAVANHRGTKLEDIDAIREKARRWDELNEKVDKMYEEDSEADLVNVGEAAASAFGYLDY